MQDLTDYLDIAHLRAIQRWFWAIAETAVRIWSADGTRCLVGEAGAGESACDGAGGPGPRCVPVFLEDQRVGYLSFPPGPAEPLGGDQRNAELLSLMAEVLGTIGGRERQLRYRLEELGTLYNLAAEFASRRSLESVLDLVARTVVDVLGVKACSIRVLNPAKTELLVKSVAGLSEEYLRKGPILLSESRIDQEVLSTGKPVYVADEREDERVLYRQEARAEGLVSALCVPMIYKGGPEGVIRVYSDQRYEFDWFEVSLMKAISSQAATAVVNTRLFEGAIELENVRRNMAMAAQVQGRMIPARPPTVEGFDIGALYAPCYELGGDFYDFIRLPEDNWGVAICDVVGKGVRASLLMASIRASLRGHAVNVYEMSLVLDKVNRDLCADSLISDFATMFYGVLNTQDRRLTYTNAGHAPPILVRDGRLCHLDSGGTLLGVVPMAHYEHQSIVLQPGDLIFAYTDGLTEALNFADEAFGTERVEQAVLDAVGQGLSAQALAKHVVWTMRKFAGLQRRFDDTTVVAIRAL